MRFSHETPQKLILLVSDFKLTKNSVALVCFMQHGPCCMVHASSSKNLRELQNEPYEEIDFPTSNVKNWWFIAYSSKNKALY